MSRPRGGLCRALDPNLFAVIPAPIITVENSRLILIALAASTILIPLWSRCTYRATEVVPLSTARGWAHALAIWDYMRGKTMAWQASGAGVSSVRRFRVGVVTWNGLISVSWIALAVGRTIQFRSPRYVVVILLRASLRRFNGSAALAGAQPGGAGVAPASGSTRSLAGQLRQRVFKLVAIASTELFELVICQSVPPLL